MEMLGGFSDLLCSDQQGNRGQGMGVGCWTVKGAPGMFYECGSSAPVRYIWSRCSQLLRVSVCAPAAQPDHKTSGSSDFIARCEQNEGENLT